MRLTETPNPQNFTRLSKGISTPKHKFVMTLIYIILSLWTLAVLFPLAWSIINSFKTDRAIFFEPWAFPEQINLANWERAWTAARISEFFANTLIVVVPALLVTLLLASMVAYVVACFEFRGRTIIFYLFVAGMMFPMFLGLVPLYLITQELHLRNSFLGLIIVYIAYSLPFTVFFMTGFFKGIPRDFMEVAAVDGANHYQTFFYIMLPMARPGLVSVGIFNFISMWNQYILPTIMIDSAIEGERTKYVLAQGLYYLQARQQYSNDWSGLFAAVTIVMIPTMIVYVVFFNRIQASFSGALKG